VRPSGISVQDIYDDGYQEIGLSAETRLGCSIACRGDERIRAHRVPSQEKSLSRVPVFDISMSEKPDQGSSPRRPERAFNFGRT
jgi:hypothetical protein